MMVNRSWLLNSGDDTPLQEGNFISQVARESDDTGDDSHLESAIYELRRQIDIVNELLEKNKSNVSSRITRDPHRAFDLYWGKIAQLEYNFRRKRDKIFFGFKIFSDPAWDILLDLFIAEHKGIRLPTSSVALGSGVPATTTLRWLYLLEEKGLIYREDDLLDGRRSFVRLTELSISLLQESLSEIYGGSQLKQLLPK